MKIEITVAGKKVKLSVEDARELYRELGELYGEPASPAPVPYYPIIWPQVDPCPPSPSYPIPVWYGTDSTTTTNEFSI